MITTFWKWLGSGAQAGVAGYQNIVNWYLTVHVLVAVALSKLVNANPFEFAEKALFPASAILIGISLAWTTRAATILQNTDFRSKVFNNERPAEDYIYNFQLSILLIMATVGYVAIMAGGGLSLSVFSSHTDEKISGFFMYLFISLSARECWGAINFTNLLNLLDVVQDNKK